ncbi:hypothetical protein, partial [Neisseria montereyensis]
QTNGRIYNPPLHAILSYRFFPIQSTPNTIKKRRRVCGIATHADFKIQVTRACRRHTPYPCRLPDTVSTIVSRLKSFQTAIVGAD